MNTKILLSVVTSLIATAVYAFDPPPVGSAAPDFSLPDAKGGTHSLSQYKGNMSCSNGLIRNAPVVKKHMAAATCKNCRIGRTSKGVVWLTIDSTRPRGKAISRRDRRTKIAESCEDAATVLHRSRRAAGRASAPRTRPDMVIINPEGKIAL